MQKEIEDILAEVNEYKTENLDKLEAFRIRLLGKKGKINDLFNTFKALPPEQKRLYGKPLNELKNMVLEKISLAKEAMESNAIQHGHTGLDLTRPAIVQQIGARHPVSLIRNEIIDIFHRVGFNVSDGPEIEDDWHNFSALNFPPEHPARDMQDTFFIERDPDIALRTHTSSVQVRVMENTSPPIKTLSPGRVFRNEAISARAHCIFHQVEGLYIDENVSFADLKQVLLYFAQEMFGKDTQIRLRPSYFPFTEPSAEMDISCNICGQKGCNICKYTGWLEILGCGMIDPNVLENSGIDSKKFTGYAFGMGIERIGLLKYYIRDIRLYFENDIRFLQQFCAE
jgi:phenylalanyl-tRNA synthetase alpha chain